MTMATPTATANSGVSDRLDSLIQRIHASSGDEQAWNSVVAAVSELFGGVLAAIERHHFASGHGTWMYQAPADRQMADDYAAKHSVRNPWFMSSAEYAPARIFTGEELIRPEELVKSDFYREFLHPRDLLHRLCGVIARYPDSVCHFSVYRGPQQPPFGAEDKILLGRILMHLSLALGNHWKLLQAGGLNQIFWSLIEHFDYASFLVNGDGTVIHRNNKSDDFMLRFGKLLLSEGKLVAANAIEQRTLKAALKEVANASRENTMGLTKVVTLSRTPAEQPIIVTLRPIGSAYSLDSGQHRTIVFVTVKDPTEIPHPHSCSFAKLYELTPAQGRLSALVFSGYTLSDAAKRLRVSDNTIRSHLKQIYLKTNTHGQMELVQLHGRVCDDHF